MKSRELLLTVSVSVLTTLAVTRLEDRSFEAHVVAAEHESVKELTVDRLIVRDELIVSDTGDPWEKGFEAHQIPRGVVMRSLAADSTGKPGVAGIWVRSRLIRSEIDDPFDDRIHAINRDGSMFRAPGHISWNVWLDGAWRQVAIIQGETLENSEIPLDQWSGGNHPGRLRFQSFRPHHPEPFTDVIAGQGMMSVGGGGYGGGGLPYPSEVLQLWGGSIQSHAVPTPTIPRIISDDNSGPHRYSLIAIGPQGNRSERSATVTANGLATLEWDSVPGADAYLIVRDEKEFSRVLRIEGANKHWKDSGNHY